MSECRALVDMQALREGQFRAWLSGRPEVVRRMANDFPPWFEYSLLPHRTRAVVVSYAEDGTVSIHIYTLLLGLCHVHGIDPYLRLIPIHED